MGKFKKTQFIDSYRNIIRQFVSFLSVVIIAMLAVTIFLGILFASKAISDNGNYYYDEGNYRDIEVISTYALTANDINTLRNVEGVYDIEGAYQVPAVLKWKGTNKDIEVVSQTERINKPILIDGRFPEGIDECCVEKGSINGTDIKIGDKITVVDSSGGMVKYLKTTEYTVTGIVYHPELLCHPMFIPGNRYIVVSPDAFDSEAMENTFNKAFITLSATRGMYRFDKEYTAAVNETLERINSLADERAMLRYQDVYGSAEDKINEGQSQLDDARSQLDDAHESIESGRARLESGQSELESAQQELIDSESRLSDAAVTLESGRARIDEGQRQLDVTGAQLRDALNTLNGYEAQINSAKAQLDEGRARIDEAQETIAMATEFLHDFSVEINNHKDELRDTLRSAIRSVIGDYADMFDWTDSGELPEVGDPNADFTKYPVTRGFILDLNKSLGDNLYAAIASLGIPEEDLRAAFEAASQIYEELSDGTTWLDRIVEYAVEKYRYYEQEYEDIADCARSWNDYNAQYIDGMARYQAGLEEYNTRLAQYNSARAELDRRWDQYYSGLARYNSGRRQLDDARTQWESGNAEYQSGQSQLEEGRQSIESGAGALESGRADLVERESQYESGLSEYESGLEQLEQSREELIKMDQCRWIVLSAQESSAYVNIARSSQNLKDVAMTFSGVFLFVAALVIFSTLGRIIDEQRTMVGATKAMGLYNREVFTKYLSFGLSGTVIGMALGVVSAYLIVQMIILKGYGKAFIYGMGNYSFNIPLTIIVVIAGAILATVTVWFACHELLRSTAVELMQGKIPSIKYMSKTGKSSTGYLYSKLILRNMLTDKKRVAATIVSVTGCCALLVGGFTIQYAIQNCVTGQFERYEHYDMKVRFDPAKSGNISEVLTENGASYYPVLESVYPVRVSGRLLSMDLLCGDLDGIGDYFTLIDTVTGEEADGNTEGVWIHRKVSESYGLSAGDDIIIFNRTMKPFRVRVAGVYENFIGYYMFMNRQTYSSLFGEEPSDNTYLVINNGADQKSLSALLKVTDGIKSIVDTADSRASYERVSSVLNSVSLICIVMSAMMAYFILLNLVSMFINQKKRELTVMRVNGFSLKQVINYVAREFFVSTVIGTILGLGSGALLGYRVIRLIESDMTQFDRMIQWRGWIFSIIITFIFVTLVCIPAFRKIKYLRLTDINE